MASYLIALSMLVGTILLVVVGAFFVKASIVIAVGALIVGATVGWGVQHVLTSLRYDEGWEKAPEWKKRNLAATGAIAALSTGLLILSRAPSFQPEEFLFKLWLWQTASAPSGATVLDILDTWLRGRRS